MRDSSDMDGESRNQATVEPETVGTTIVGARPPGHGRGHAKIPHGIEVLVKKASVDSEFREILLKKRAEAAHDIDLSLSRAEAAMLNNIPRHQIEKIIEHTTVPDEERRFFLGKVGAAMAAVLTIGLMPSRVGGIRPDDPRPQPKPPSDDCTGETPRETGSGDLGAASRMKE